MTACEPVNAQPTGTPIVINGTVVIPAETSTPEPTLAPSPTPKNVPDLSGETVSLIFLCDKTGPLGATNAGRIAAVEDGVAAINADGGLFGAELDLRFADTLGTVDGAQRAEARLLRQFEDASLVLICDPVSEGALHETLNDDSIPALAPGDYAEEGGLVFGLDATPSQQLAYFLQDLKLNWVERRPQGAGPQIRLALLTWPIELGGSLATPELLAYAEELGIEVVLQTEQDLDESLNVFDFIYTARDENANVIYTNMHAQSLAELLNSVNNLGLAGRFVIGAQASSYDNVLYTYLADPAFAQGVYLNSPWAWWSESNPGIEQAKDLLGENGLETEWTDWGYIQMAGAVDLARRALEDVLLQDGLGGLDPDAVARALAALKDYPVLDGLYVVNYSASQRSLTELRTWQVGAVPGELILLGDYSAVPVFNP